MENFLNPEETKGVVKSEPGRKEATSVVREPRYKNIVHLWEFLLELLAEDSCRSLISWIRKERGEFKLKNPEEVAKRWGILKRKKGMNYEKLGRALRYYYQQGIIKKVSRYLCFQSLKTSSLLWGGLLDFIQFTYSKLNYFDTNVQKKKKKKRNCWTTQLVLPSTIFHNFLWILTNLSISQFPLNFDQFPSMAEKTTPYKITALNYELFSYKWPHFWIMSKNKRVI